MEEISDADFVKRWIKTAGECPIGEHKDFGKPRFDLLSPVALRKLADVLTYGATKYADRNWEKGILYSRIFASMQRHMWAWWGGEDNDPESGLSHLAHAAFNCMALLDYLENNDHRLDDRPARKLKEQQRAKYAVHCTVCGSWHDQGKCQGPKTAKGGPKRTTWKCLICGRENENERSVCVQCNATVHPDVNAWTCPLCHISNPRHEMKCRNCGT